MDNLYAGLGAELVPGKLRGFRVWQPTHGCRLASLSMNYVWSGSEIDAECMKVRTSWNSFAGDDWLTPDLHNRSHDIPVRNCTCGIYAKHTPDLNAQTYVSGVIDAWGRVELGSDGFRAQKSRIVALAMPSVILKEEFAQFIRILEETYKGVQFFPTNEAMWKEYPPVDVRELLASRE